MKIYFAGSIRGGRDDQELYLKMIQTLQEHGTVLTEHIGEKTLSHLGEEINEKFIFERDMDWVGEADVIVAEVSTPSLGVGYEIGRAESMQKPILCLYRPQENRSLSAMIRGNQYLTVKEYANLEEMTAIFQKFFAS